MAMATLIVRCCRKTNQLKSVQGFGIQRTLRKIFLSPRNRKKVLPQQHLLPGVAKKLTSASLCRGMESKEPIKIFINNCKSKKQKKSIAMVTLVARCAKKLINSTLYDKDPVLI